MRQGSTGGPIGRRMPPLWGTLMLVLGGLLNSPAWGACGQRVEVPAHDGHHTPYALSRPAAGVVERGVVVLLPGATGRLKLDAGGCVTSGTANYLVRSAERFRDAGYVTALVDVPNDHRGPEGLAGFRATLAHGDDLAHVVADVRARMGGPVWVIGTSRGAISAANLASRSRGLGTPDGVVLSSSVVRGAVSRTEPWLSQTVFDLPLADITIPALVLTNAQDACVRSPTTEMPQLLQSLGSTRKQLVRVGGDATGSAAPTPPVRGGCAGKSAHGFVGQEDVAVRAMVGFMQGL